MLCSSSLFERMVEDHDILIAIFTGILKALDTFIAMYHVMVAQQSFYVICAVQFVACWEAADMARTWHRDEWFTQGDAWYLLNDLPTQTVKDPIHNDGLRQCAPAQMRCGSAP